MDALSRQHLSPGTVGLLLTGGGARAAYQVGVLKAIARMARECGAPPTSPFQVIAGTSAGALNASALACQSDRFQFAVDEMVNVWQHFRAEQVYRADSLGVIRSGASWLTMMSVGWALARVHRSKPRSLLDNSPLEGLLHRMVQFHRLPELMRAGHLHALAVTASSYTTGLHVTFYESLHEVPSWTRSQRVAMRTALSVRHLLASAAIPFVFPSIELDMQGESEWFGDGSMRQAAPISPAVHLGAERILIIGSGRLNESPGHRIPSDGYPSVAQIAGHALSNIFLDALAVDVERLERINATLSLLPPEARARTPLRPIQALVIAPSDRLDVLAADHLNSLPTTIRTLLRGVGVNRKDPGGGGSALASYLLFEAPYTRALMAMGERDTEARRSEVEAFFGWTRPTLPGAPIAVAGPMPATASLSSTDFSPAEDLQVLKPQA